MKRRMRAKYLSLMGFLWVAQAIGADAAWMNDLAEGRKKSQAEGRPILLNFRGPDESSKRLHSEVFDQPEFIAFAEANFLLVEIDFSGASRLTPEQILENKKVADEFEVKDWPVTYVLDPNGKRLARGGYVEGGATNYIALMEKIPGLNLKPPATEVATNSPAAESPAFAQVPVVRYQELTLRGISLGKRKVALINNQSFVEGEQARLEVAGKKILVECRQIQGDRVILQVENEPQTRELRLKAKATDESKKEKP
jgi:hypothetical protein